MVIPAHDEQDLLGHCLDALDECRDVTPVPVTVTVVLDSCTDGSARVCEGRARVLRVDARNVGMARAAGFDQPGRARAGGTVRATGTGGTAGTGNADGTVYADGHWYATTDADSRVPRTWLVDQLALAEAGADVVAGLIEVDDWSDWSPATRQRYLEGYRRGPGHRHVHGANIGVSARAYRRLGGFEPLALHEDVRLVERAERAGMSVAWSTAAPVLTSARRAARAFGGFAGHLATTDQAVSR